MEKIGILTINDYSNLGNRLQNYAVQEVLIEIGKKPTTIIHRREGTASSKIKLNKLSFKDIKKKLKNKYFFYKYKKEYLLKQKRFRDFSDAHIIESKFWISEGNFPRELDTFDFFLTGSDQVWNPQFSFGTSIDFLSFTDKKKKIAFSPSFGISHIPSQFEEFFKTNIENFGKLSVREEAGAKIIRNLTGKEAEVLVDPTLLLSKEKWKSIAAEHSNKPKKPYLLTYFLGEKSAEYKEWITNYSKVNSLDVVDLGDVKHKKYFDTDPSEFIDFINNAQIVLTDSFHGAVFSIIFEKDFIVFKRNSDGISMNSRIETLLKKFNFQNRTFENLNNTKEIESVNFSNSLKIIENEKKKSLDFLISIINN